MTIKPADELRELVIRIFLAAGADERNAEGVAEHLVLSNLRGVDTHGIIHIPEYVSNISDELTIPTAWPELIGETASSATVKGNLTFGHVSARYAMEVAIEKAGPQGMATVALVQSNHIGRLGHYLEMAAAKNLVSLVWASGFSVTNARSVPYGGRERILDTNPVAIGIPLGSGPPILIDYATTALSGVKVLNAQRRNEQLPPNSIVDKEGKATTDPNDFFAGGAHMPFGGHKGYALMVAAEYLGRIFAGADPYAHPEQGVPLFRHQGVTMIVLKADLFQALSDYQNRAEEMAQRIRAVPPAPGFEEVMLPGDMETRATAARQQDGIPIHDDVWQGIVDTASSLGINL